MKKILALALLLGCGLAQAQTYNKFKPANGVLKGATTTYVTSAAASSDITALWSGTCNGSTFLRGDGACASAGGGGGGSGLPAFIGAAQQNPGSTGTFGNYTLAVRMYGGHVVNPMSSFKISVLTTVTGLIVDAVVLRRTLANSPTYIDSTAITFASNPTPTWGVGDQVSDTISVAVDSAHDYYVLIYFDSSTPGTAAVAQYTDAQSGLSGCFTTGNHTADSDTTGLSGFGQTIYGMHAAVSP